MSRRARHLNPANLGCQVALDARFETAYGNGVAVDTWTGRPGTSVNATGSGTSRPLFTTNSINGQPALTFDGSNDVMTLNATTLFQNVGKGCILTVVRDDNAASGDSAHTVMQFFVGGGVTSSARALVASRLTTGVWATGGRRLDLPESFSSSGGIANSGAAAVASGIFNWSGNAQTVRVNGSAGTSGTFAGGAGNTANTASYAVTLGSSDSASGTTSRLPGVIAAVIATNIDLGTANLKRVEQALARAFNLACA